MKILHTIFLAHISMQAPQEMPEEQVDNLLNELDLSETQEDEASEVLLLDSKEEIWKAPKDRRHILMLMQDAE